MSWTNAAAWSRLLSGDDCPMCADIHLEVNVFGYKVAELRQSYVRLPRNQFRRGWTVVALKRHANELFELSENELAGFWRDVADAARAVHAVYQPVKMNYAVLGNLCPHIPCHLVPQFATDDPSASLNMNAEEVLLDARGYQDTIAKLRGGLPPDLTEARA